MPEPQTFSLKDKKFKFNLPVKKAQVEDDGFLYIEFALATTDVDLEGEQLTDKCLKDMVSQALGINVYLDHKYDLDHTIGPVVGAKIEGNELWVKARVRKELKETIWDILESETKMGGSFGGICEEDFLEDGIRKLDKVNLLDATFTPMPVNTATSGSAKESVKGCTVCNQIFKSLESKYGIERNLEVKNVTRTEDESFESIRDAVQAAIDQNDERDNKPTWIKLTFPDSVIYVDWEEDKVYELPYSVDEEGNVTLGEPVEVQEQYVEKKLEVFKTKSMEHEPPADYKEKTIGDENMDETKVQEMIDKSNTKLFDKIKGLVKPEEPEEPEVKAIDPEELTKSVTESVTANLLKAFGIEEEVPENPEDGKVMIIDAKAFEEMQADTIQKAILEIAKQREGPRKSKSLGGSKFMNPEEIEPEEVEEKSVSGKMSTRDAAKAVAERKALT